MGSRKANKDIQEITIRSQTVSADGKKEVVVADWKAPLPPYIRWLHRAAIDCRAADEYTAGHIVGFKLGEQDQLLCPELEPYATVYMVYRDRKGDPRAL
mgnify:CR=1 FL=1